MIFGGEPENRHGIDAAARGFLGDANRRDRFVEGVGGAGEKSYLLAGDDCDGSGGQAIEIPHGGGIDFVSGHEARVLFAQHFDYRFSDAGIEADFVRGSVNARGGWRMRVILRNLAEIFEKRGEELRGVGNFTERDTVGVRLRILRSHDALRRQRQARGAVDERIVMRVPTVVIG